MYILGNHIVIPQGNNGVIDFQILDNGEPYTIKEHDLVVFTVKKHYSDDESLIQKNITTFIELTTVDTSIPLGDYAYDIKFYGADGREETIVGPAIFTIGKVVNNG